ncbi:MAG: diacylglycerol kinase [Roseateles sp.]|jgi:diacylglycerol kinase (ATP)|uniref:Diacylglycerol kinase n=1 Tax=Roseateles asaccharophilus TaxID=582607 RepID=A0ABU2AG29_9BURK|nr:diacylglycerol kinase [Roseateles asaccharophilus]MDR7336181.1 diacylglycerol kinase (ATP) [Roseateles asaccharophilus]
MSASNPYKGRTGLERIVYAFRYSMDGLVAAFKGESAFRQEVVLGALLLPVAAWLAMDWVQLVLMLGALLIVLIVELLNSAIEATVDRISFEHNLLSKRAKDMGSAAVLLALVFFALVWGAVLWMKFCPAA